MKVKTKTITQSIFKISLLFIKSVQVYRFYFNQHERLNFP